MTGTPAGQGSSSGRSTPSAAAVARRLPSVGVRPASQAAMSVSMPLIDRRPAAGVPMATARQAERLEHKPLPLRHPGGQEVEELLAERPAPGFRATARAEVGGVDDELAPQRQAAVEDDSPAVS